MNREEAIKATNAGAIAACISGALTFVIFLIALFSNSSGELAFWNDPAVFFDVILIFICAFGIYKKSRTAAIFMFIYFIVSKIVIGIDTGQASGIGMGLIFLYFFGKATQGAFVFHKLEKKENPNYRPTSKLVMYIGIPVTIIFVLLIGFGALTMTGVVPSTEVQTGSKLPEEYRIALINNDIIYQEDTVKYFYSYGLTSILNGGSILTDNRIIMYFTDENQEIAVYELYFEDITKIELIETGNYLNDSIYRIYGNSADAWLEVSLSTESRGDVVFIESLRSEVEP